MAIILYFFIIIMLWVTGMFLNRSYRLKHGKYTKFIMPVVAVATEKILKKDILNHGSKLMFLYGARGSDDLFTIHWAVKITSLMMFAFFPVMYISLESPGFTPAVLSCVVPLVGFLLPDIDLNAGIKIKKESVLRDYPGFCTNIAVMTGAGLEITKAWEKALEKNSSNIFYREARYVLLKHSTGVKFSDALKGFSAHLALPEIHTFVTIINQELKSGSGGMAAKLRDCAKQSWKSREDAARKKGEETISKLIFPLVLGLMGILLILAAPAIMIMKGV